MRVIAGGPSETIVPRHSLTASDRWLCKWARLALAAGMCIPLFAGLPAVAQNNQPPTPAPTQPVSEDDIPEMLVVLKDGRRFTGFLVSQNSREVVVRVGGIVTTFTMDEIDRVETLEPFIQRFNKLKEAVGDDPQQIVKLAEWLQGREKYELALSEVNRALELDKDNGAALHLAETLKQQIVLKHNRLKKAEPEAQTPGAAPAGPKTHAPVPHTADVPLLTPEQIRLIKVYETKFEEHPRIRIERDTIKRMLDAYQGHPLVPSTLDAREAILRQSPADVLDLMFKLQARDFYPLVDILDQPKSFGVFRDRVVRTWLVNSCSTTACHGGTEAGRFVLATHWPNSDATVYTDFLILTRFHMSDGEGLIDWDRPERSTLLQLGLPRDKSTRPHPEAARGALGRDAWKPAFHGTDDPQFKEAVEWIKMLFRPRPEYPIPYTPLKPFDPPPKASAPGITPPPSGSPAPSTSPKPGGEIASSPQDQPKQEPKGR